MPRDQHGEGVRESSRVDLRRWILTDHDSASARFEQAIVGCVPIERWKERADGGGSSIAWLLFHLRYHQDLAVNTAIRHGAPVIAEHRAPLGLSGLAAHEGLGETERPAVTAALSLDALIAYASAVASATHDYLSSADLDRLDDGVELGALGELAGVEQAEVPWLYGMWSERSVGWLLQWEAIGHVHGHVAEMISVRARLGLSPF
jgi:hypothetical protein